MDQVLKDHKLLKLNQDEIDNLKFSVTIKEIKVIFLKALGKGISVSRWRILPNI